MAEKLAPKTPFGDLFWQCRAMNLPVVRLLTARTSPARSYHSLSAGYAGLFGAVEAYKQKVPFLITEHGIYSRERDIELARADWIPDRRALDDLGSRVPTFSPLRRMWSRFFRRLSQIAYHQAVKIVTLSEVNRDKLLADGAPREKTLVVPNGVELKPPPDAAAADDESAAPARRLRRPRGADQGRVDVHTRLRHGAARGGPGHPPHRSRRGGPAIRGPLPRAGPHVGSREGDQVHRHAARRARSTTRSSCSR